MTNIKQKVFSGFVGALILVVAFLGWQFYREISLVNSMSAKVQAMDASLSNVVIYMNKYVIPEITPQLSTAPVQQPSEPSKK